jgi:hypothetical protein
MKRPENPCLPGCAGRTITCKFDGSCNNYKEYSEAQRQYNAMKTKRSAAAFSAADIEHAAIRARSTLRRL